MTEIGVVAARGEISIREGRSRRDQEREYTEQSY